jgi:hypothetical protein
MSSWPEVVQRRNRLKKMAISAMLATITACASVDQGTPEQIVSRRSVERAALLMRGDFEGAYKYSTPGYRSLESVGEYSARWLGAPMWEEASVAKVDCQIEPTERCQIALAIKLRLPSAGLVTTHLQETWVWSGGQWYLFQEVGL